MQGGMFRQIADSLIAWASAIIESPVDEEERHSRRMSIEQMIAWLLSLSSHGDESELVNSRLKVRQFGEWNKELGKFTAYKSGFLLECLILMFSLRDASKLASTVKQAMRVLPPMWAASLTALMRHDRTLPSAATLSRARLYVDVGFMLFCRRRHEDCDAPVPTTGPGCSRN